MSLQDVIREQQTIISEQQMARDEFAKMRQRLDSYVKGELQRFSERLNATEDRINRLLGGVEDLDSRVQMTSSPAKPGDRGLPGFYKQGVPGSPLKLSAGTRDARSPPSAGASPAIPRQRISGGYASSSPQKPTGPLDTQGKKQTLASAVQDTPSDHVWEEPKDGKANASTVDQAEQALRRCFEKSKEFQRNPNNPAQGLQLIFARVDRNHSAKIDQNELCELCNTLDLQISQAISKGLFTRYDIDRSGLISIDEFGRMLFKLDGDKHAKALTAIARMREALSLRAGGFETLRTMGNQFRILDHDKSGQLTREEFNMAFDVLFSCFNMKFSVAEKNSLFLRFDIDNSGTVDYNEFIRGIRGNMNEFRLGWVSKAFDILDKDHSGVVTSAEMARTYDVSQNPAVQSGKVSPADAIALFMHHFDINGDGNITKEEFIENYQWVSASIENDDYFELMMRNAWHIAGGEGWSANTSNLRVLVKHTLSPDEVVCVLNDLGLPRDPALKLQEVVKRLREQGVKDIAKVEFFG